MQFENIDGVEFFVDKDNDSKIYAEYAVPTLNGTKPKDKMFISLDDYRFASFLRSVIIPKSGMNAKAGDIIRNIRDNIITFGCDDIVDPKVRTAGTLKTGLVEYSLGGRNNRCVRVTSDGWGITNKPRHKFLNHSASLVQVDPTPTDKNLIDLVRPYINADENSVLLFSAWLVQSFCEGHHSALVVSAPRGCGKTTAGRIIRRILDPSRTTANILNHKGDALLTLLTNSYLVDFDNVRSLSCEESDVMCVAVTGGTYSKREAYSTNTNASFKLQNVVVLNGIGIIPTESDFAQRCLLLKLRPINEKTRLTESEIEENFTHDLPHILGGIFDTLAKAMTIMKSLKPKKIHRLADAYLEMLCIAVALGLTEDEFNGIYEENIKAIDKARSETDLVYAVKEYMEKCVHGRSIEGKVLDVYGKICNSFSGNRSALPKSASAFSRKISTEYSAFQAAGLTVNLDDTYADGTRIKIIKNK